MFSMIIYLQGLAVLVVAVVIVWLISIRLHNVSVVDSVWPLLFILTAVTYAVGSGLLPSPRGKLILMLVGVWALRLSGYITWRNFGHGEDRRYQTIRARNEPNFAFKSLYLVFLLQAVMAWVISLPLLGAILSDSSLGLLDWAGAVLWLCGLVFEAGGDCQLARFKAKPQNNGKVMDQGFWRYTRHPNYFGDFCVWWGFFLIALSAGAWWAIVGPLGMSLLLMRVSGVTLLEKDIGERRPEYADYISRTNVFFPGPPKDV